MSTVLVVADGVDIGNLLGVDVVNGLVTVDGHVLVMLLVTVATDGSLEAVLDVADVMNGLVAVLLVSDVMDGLLMASVLLSVDIDVVNAFVVDWLVTELVAELFVGALVMNGLLVVVLNVAHVMSGLVVVIVMSTRVVNGLLMLSLVMDWGVVVLTLEVTGDALIVVMLTVVVLAVVGLLVNSLLVVHVVLTVVL